MGPTFLRHLRASVRKNFIAGLFVALPVGITLAALLWVWGRINEPLRQIFGYTESHTGEWWGPIRALMEDNGWGKFVPPLLGLCILGLSVLLLGLIVRSFLGKYLLSLVEDMVARVPLVGALYASLRQLAEAFVDGRGRSRFQSAVLVQFPTEGSWAIGFVTGTAAGPLAESVRGGDGVAPADDVLTVFVPTTPLPTQGFTLVLPRSATRPLAMKVEEAVKLVISGGVIAQKPADSPE